MSADKRTLRDSTIRAIASDANLNDAQGVLRHALVQLQTDLFMLGAAVCDEDAARQAPIEPGLVRCALDGLRGRLDAIRIFADNCLDVKFLPLDEDLAGAKRDLDVLKQVAAQQKGGAS